jgi:hypothetical protein
MARADPQASAFSVVLPTLAAMLLLAALIAILTALALAFPGPTWIPFWNLNREAYDSFHHLGGIAITSLLVLGCVAGGAAVGLLFRRRWAWWMAVFIFVANAAGDLISLVHTDEALHYGSGIVIAAGFAILLCLPSVRRSLH